MKKIIDITFILVSIFVIIMAAYEGATSHADCSECNQGMKVSPPHQFYVESGEIGLGYMLVNW